MTASRMAKANPVVAHTPDLPLCWCSAFAPFCKPKKQGRLFRTMDIDNEHNSNINAQFKKNCHLEVKKNIFFFWVIKNITKFRDGAGAGVVSSESGTVGGAGGLGTVGAGAGA